jgi:hypothetical protein
MHTKVEKKKREISEDSGSKDYLLLSEPKVELTAGLSEV